MTLDSILDSGPKGSLPITAEMLPHRPSGDLCWTQNAGMGWDPAKLTGSEILLLSTHGGIRPNGSVPDGAHRHVKRRPRSFVGAGPKSSVRPRILWQRRNTAVDVTLQILIGVLP
jgi:hypothetical protein